MGGSKINGRGNLQIAPTINFVKALKLEVQIQTPDSQLVMTELELEEDW